MSAKWYAFAVLDNYRLVVSESGHPTMLRSVERQDVLCAGRFRITDVIEVFGASGALPSVEKKHRIIVEDLLIDYAERQSKFPVKVIWR